MMVVTIMMTMIMVVMIMDDGDNDDDDEVPLGEMAKLSVFSLSLFEVYSLACFASTLFCLRVVFELGLVLPCLFLPFLVLSCLELLSSPVSFFYHLVCLICLVYSYTHKLPSPPSSAIDLHHPKKIRYLEANIKVLVPLKTKKKQIKIKGTIKGR